MSIERLLDEDEREHVIECICEWIKAYPQGRARAADAETIKKMILEPLGEWLDKEWPKVKKTIPGYSDDLACDYIEWAELFHSNAEELIIAMLHPNMKPGADVYIGNLDKSWEKFQSYMRNAAFYRVKKFERKPGEPREKRTAPLCHEMGQTFLGFMQKHGREPSALELWRALPIGEVIQEKNKDFIWWKTDSGGEPKMAFKTFQNHFTKLLDEYEKNKKVKK